MINGINFTSSGDINPVIKPSYPKMMGYDEDGNFVCRPLFPSSSSDDVSSDVKSEKLENNNPVNKEDEVSKQYDDVLKQLGDLQLFKRLQTQEAVLEKIKDEAVEIKKQSQKKN